MNSCVRWTIRYCGKTEAYKDELMCALYYVMDRKGQALVFMDMCESDKELYMAQEVPCLALQLKMKTISALTTSSATQASTSRL
jgi:hypothetical protein